MLSISAGLLTAITLEYAKLFYRKYIIKDMAYDFPKWFYETMLPFFTFAWGVILGLVGLGEPVGFTFKTLIEWGFAVIISVAVYSLGIKPLRDYSPEN